MKICQINKLLSLKVFHLRPKEVELLRDLSMDSLGANSFGLLLDLCFDLSLDSLF